eukprot:12359812-Ditylum_brightwellii.AAC.1
MLEKSEDLPLWLIRGNAIATVMYGFGDASGGAFGSTFATAQDVNYCFGLWDDVTSTSSLNLHEGKNLVDVIKKKQRSGRLDGTELFMSTEKSVFEGAYYRSTLFSKLIHGKVLCMRKLEIEH